MRNGASGASLAVQWLRLRASNADCVGSIPGQGTKIPHATWHSQRKKKERERKEKGDKKQTLMTCPNPTVLTAILQVNRKNKGCVCVCVCVCVPTEAEREVYKIGSCDCGNQQTWNPYGHWVRNLDKISVFLLQSWDRFLSSLVASLSVLKWPPYWIRSTHIIDSKLLKVTQV